MAILLCVLLPSLPVLAQNEDGQGCFHWMHQGEIDGKAAASKIWILAGCGCGMLGVGAAYLLPRAVPGEMLVGIPEEQIHCYVSGWNEGSTETQFWYAASGVAIQIAVYVILVVAMASDSDSDL